MIREDGTAHTLEPIINTGTRAQPTAISVPNIRQNPSTAFFSECFMLFEKTTNQ